MPQFDVRSQSTDIGDFDKKGLEIKRLSSYSTNHRGIISSLKKLSSAYLEWIKTEARSASHLTDNEKELGLQNIEKCKAIHKRMRRGIELLSDNPLAFRSFQLANTAIYLQMFQNAWHFNNKKGGFEAFSQSDPPQYSYHEYGKKPYPTPDRVPCWRPFQLAFILQCLPSFIEDESADRDLVDLLYFPTGGGKTEAYLAISAFLIFWRRLRYPKEYRGVNIIIRYTLRLLSSQQFERTTKLILACEFIRSHHTDLGNERISIGFWVGDRTIPNTVKNAQIKLKELQTKMDANAESGITNPFQLTTCQWCNTRIISRTEAGGHYKVGHHIEEEHLISYCLNPHCIYSESMNGFPIVLLDDDLYYSPPTMLFGTVDKFVRLAWHDHSTCLFNDGGNRKPELIIQDELHLLSGPLGSMVGLFENVILSLCTTEFQRPKIIVSTATIKNVAAQIRGLYSRDVRIFPQNGTDADDTFFSTTLQESNRRYIGLMPTGKLPTTLSMRLNAALFFARLELMNASNVSSADQFWTILSYFKSLKHVGQFANRVTTELRQEIRHLQERHMLDDPAYRGNYNRLYTRFLELTGRVPDQKIKENLDRLSISFNGDLENHQAYDLILATNMISVGLDVDRLGIMLINGMPMNTAEYIQASSRVARKHPGLVFSLYDPSRTRDLSYFEDFVSFHKTFYKQVEPISITPFAENALDKLLFTLIVAYFRHKMQYTSNYEAVALATRDNSSRLMEELEGLFKNHSFADEEDVALIMSKVRDLIKEWEMRLQHDDNLLFYRKDKRRHVGLLKPIQERDSLEDNFIVMQSLRNVEPEINIKIQRY
jgi:hypothetical protein